VLAVILLRRAPAVFFKGGRLAENESAIRPAADDQAGDLAAQDLQYLDEFAFCHVLQCPFSVSMMAGPVLVKSYSSSTQVDPVWFLYGSCMIAVRFPVFCMFPGHGTGSFPLAGCFYRPRGCELQYSREFD
jgi:hypothetical protein